MRSSQRRILWIWPESISCLGAPALLTCRDLVPRLPFREARSIQRLSGKIKHACPVRVINASFQGSHLENTPPADPSRRHLSLSDERPALAVLPVCVLGNISDDKGPTNRYPLPDDGFEKT